MAKTIPLLGEVSTERDIFRSTIHKATRITAHPVHVNAFTDWSLRGNNHGAEEFVHYIQFARLPTADARYPIVYRPFYRPSRQNHIPMKLQKMTPCKDATTYYIWLGGSCDYGHAERWGGGAYLIEYQHQIIDEYVISEPNTTEFRMILKVMIHAMTALPTHSNICFLSNVAYLQNYDKTPTEKSANADLIHFCIAAKAKHATVTLKLIPYHKYEQLPHTHDLAHEAMLELRNYPTSKK